MLSKLLRNATLISSSLLLSASLSAQPSLPAGSCSDATLTGNYGYVINGTTGGLPVTTVGQIATDGNGTIAGFETISLNGEIAANVAHLGTYQINSNCTGTATITPAGRPSSNFSLAVLSGAKQIQMVETDSGTVESGNAYAQGVTTCSSTVAGSYGLQGGGIEIGSGPTVVGGQINLHGDGTLVGTESGSINGAIFSGARISGVYKIGSNCMGGAVVAVGHGTPIHLNLVVVNGQKGVLFIQTDTNSLSSGILQQ